MASNIFTQTLISASQSSKEVTANENFASLKTGIRGLLSKSVAGSSNVTLTEAEAENMLHEYTGALTANIEVRVPAYSKFYAIYNNTSGSFSLTVKTAAGSGIVVKQGVRTLLYCDGTNVVNLSAQRLQGLEIDATAPTDAYVLTWVAAESKIKWQAAPGAGSGAPNDAKYIVAESNGTLSAEIIIPAMAGHPDAKPAIAQTEDDDFDAGSLAGKWSWHNQGAATISFANSHAQIVAPADSSVNVKAVVQTAPSAPYAVACKVSLHARYGDFHAAGIALLENGTGKINTFAVGRNGGFVLAVYSYTNATTFSTTRMTMSFGGGGPVYLKVEDDNTNLKFSFSLDGRHYYEVYSMARATGFTTAADRVGIYAYAQNASYAAHGSFDWFRRTA